MERKRKLQKMSINSIMRENDKKYYLKKIFFMRVNS